MSDETPDPHVLDRKPAPRSARAAVAKIVRAHAKGDGEADMLLENLGDEIRQALSHEHEDDLDRIRPRVFEIGVRSALRVAREQGAIGEADEQRFVLMLGAEAERHRISSLVEQRLLQLGVSRTVVESFLVELRRELP